MNLNDFKAAILDMDGVITQTAKLHARAWKMTFDEFLTKWKANDGQLRQPFDRDLDYRKYVDGKPRYDGVQSFLKSRGIDLPYGDEDDESSTETVCGLGNRKNQLFHEILEQEGVQVYDDTVERIGMWKRDGWKIAVISSSRNCEAVLKAAELLDLFDAKVDGNDLQRLQIPGKPAPDMFLHAAQQLGVEPSEAVIVEDAIAGVQAGREGGFGLVVGVARNGQASDLRDAGANLVVSDLRELTTASYESSSHDDLQAPPSALQHFDGIAMHLKDCELALFLDYDGTLTPIVRRAEEAKLSDEMRSLLRRLAEHCTVAIVSGRDRRDAQQMVQVENVVYAGSHGFDIRGPHGLEMQQSDAVQALPDLDEAERKLRKRIEPFEGARVERKKFAIAVHYREVKREDDARRIEKVVDRVCGEHPALRKKGGKKIFELLPDVAWDKGQAVSWLTRALGLNPSRTVVIYIGDDVTDEDAFRALRRQESGIGIRVTSSTSPTDASHYLRDCNEVKEFLEMLLAMRLHEKPEELSNE